MSQTLLKRRYVALASPGQSFREFFISEMEQCKEQLECALQLCPKDRQGRPELYLLVRHLSRSGMSQTISVHYWNPESVELCQLNYVCAVLLGLALDEQRNGVKVKGEGAGDMCSHLVSKLSRFMCGSDDFIGFRWI